MDRTAIDPTNRPGGATGSAQDVAVDAAVFVIWTFVARTLETAYSSCLTLYAKHTRMHSRIGGCMAKDDEESPKNEMKVAAGAKGGTARAKALAPSHRSEIAQKAAAVRWLPVAECSGTLKIGDMTFPCAVLTEANGKVTRVLTQHDFMTGMGMYYSGWVSKNRTSDDPTAEVPLFLAFERLKPFIDRHLGDLQSIVLRYRTQNGNVAYGIKAEIIPKICEVWMDAEEQGRLGKRQKEIAQKARLMIRALAHVGIAALVDEATGYQDRRAHDALARILEEFVTTELQKWVSTFPIDYYREMCRLRGWKFDPSTTKRGVIWGTLTNNVIYQRLAPGVLEELKRVTPRDEKGRHKDKLFQRLTKDTGDPRLREHLASVVTLMRVAPDGDWKGFMKMLDRALPKYRVDPQQLQLEGFND
jgi:hypothetical protein